MAGHSHWSKIKRAKGANDAKRGKIWSKIARKIIIAAKSGGGDPRENLTLRYVIDEGKDQERSLSSDVNRDETPPGPRRCLDIYTQYTGVDTGSGLERVAALINGVAVPDGLVCSGSFAGDSKDGLHDVFLLAGHCLPPAELGIPASAWGECAESRGREAAGPEGGGGQAPLGVPLCPERTDSARVDVPVFGFLVRTGYA